MLKDRQKGETPQPPTNKKEKKGKPPPPPLRSTENDSHNYTHSYA